MRGNRIAALVGAVVLAVVLLSAGLTWLLVRESGERRHADETQADCSGRLGQTCTDVPLEQIEAVARIDLPDGTRVLDSRYVEWQDWQLQATVELPAGATDPTRTPHARRLYDGELHDGVTYGVTRTRVDGHTRLALVVFTT